MKWRDRVQEYVRDRGEGSLRNLEQARRECQDRQRWKLPWWELLGAGIEMNRINEYYTYTGELKKKKKFMVNW